MGVGQTTSQGRKGPAVPGTGCALRPKPPGTSQAWPRSCVPKIPRELKDLDSVARDPSDFQLGIRSSGSRAPLGLLVALAFTLTSQEGGEAGGWDAPDAPGSFAVCPPLHCKPPPPALSPGVRRGPRGRGQLSGALSLSLPHLRFLCP